MPAFDFGDTGPGGWQIVDEPELHLGRQLVVPDLAGWRRDRMPKLPETAYFPLAPDWLCEVLSPSTVRLDREKKLRIYAEPGVAHAWLVDPIARTLEVLRNENGTWTLLTTHAGDVTVRIEAFEAIEFRLKLLWADVRVLGRRRPRGEISHRHRANPSTARYRGGRPGSDLRRPSGECIPLELWDPTMASSSATGGAQGNAG